MSTFLKQRLIERVIADIFHKCAWISRALFSLFTGTFLTVAVLIFCGVVCLACLAALGVTAFLVSAWFLINVAMDFIYSAKIHAQDYVPFPCFQKSALSVETWPARQDKCQGSNPSAKEE